MRSNLNGVSKGSGHLGFVKSNFSNSGPQIRPRAQGSSPHTQKKAYRPGLGRLSVAFSLSSLMANYKNPISLIPRLPALPILDKGSRSTLSKTRYTTSLAFVDQVRCQGTYAVSHIICSMGAMTDRAVEADSTWYTSPKGPVVS